MTDSYKEKISYTDTRSSMPFNSESNYENIDNTCLDDREFMELYHSSKQIIKKQKRTKKIKKTMLTAGGVT